ncbi:MAG: hypothetical protein EOO10_11520 [Chitinophagaceae bacterium]|nr:MAG: hypothetical protein EOO10_11520 [Chitinophagaceae bacterium]
MKRTTIFLFTLLFLLTKSFSQEDTAQVLRTILPLKVTNIEAIVVNKNVQLLWTVSSNEDARNFEVERADGGGEYIKIGGRLSTGNTGEASYEFVDAMPRKNVSFAYRVKINGKDGTTILSELCFARVGEEAIQCRLKQNPVRNSIEAEVVSTEAGNIQVSIFTSYGQKVLSEVAKLTTGVNYLSFSSQNLLPGIHRLVLERGSERKVISFVKE